MSTKIAISDENLAHLEFMTENDGMTLEEACNYLLKIGFTRRNALVRYANQQAEKRAAEKAPSKPRKAKKPSKGKAGSIKVKRAPKEPTEAPTNADTKAA